MRNAVKFAEEILRKEKALQITKSDKLKHDYTASLRRDRGELLYYCKCRGLSVREVYAHAVQNRI